MQHLTGPSDMLENKEHPLPWRKSTARYRERTDWPLCRKQGILRLSPALSFEHVAGTRGWVRVNEQFCEGESSQAGCRGGRRGSLERTSQLSCPAGPLATDGMRGLSLKVVLALRREKQAHLRTHTCFPSHTQGMGTFSGKDLCPKRLESARKSATSCIWTVKSFETTMKLRGQSSFKGRTIFKGEKKMKISCTWEVVYQRVCVRTGVSAMNMLITERGQDPKAGSRDERGWSKNRIRGNDRAI